MGIHIKYINRAADSLFDTARPCVIQYLVGVRQHQVPTRCIPCWDLISMLSNKSIVFKIQAIANINISLKWIQSLLKFENVQSFWIKYLLSWWTSKKFIKTVVLSTWGVSEVYFLTALLGRLKLKIFHKGTNTKLRWYLFGYKTRTHKFFHVSNGEFGVFKARKKCPRIGNFGKPK